MSKFDACIIALTFVAMSVMTQDANGQTSQQYQLNIDPQTVLASLSSDQFQVHPGVTGNLSFFESYWYMESNTSAGATVTFAVSPFINQGNSSYKRDAHMRLRRLRNRGSATWAFDDRASRTRYANGKMLATVKLSSTTAGRATVGIRVRFLTEDNPSTRLPGGNYLTTVVGTISAN